MRFDISRSKSFESNFSTFHREFNCKVILVVSRILLCQSYTAKENRQNLKLLKLNGLETIRGLNFKNKASQNCGRWCEAFSRFVLLSKIALVHLVKNFDGSCLNLDYLHHKPDYRSYFVVNRDGSSLNLDY